MKYNEFYKGHVFISLEGKEKSGIMKQILKEMSPFNIIWLGIIVLITAIFGVLSFSYVDLSVFSLDTLFYALCLLAVLSIFGGFGIRKILKEKEKNYKIKLCLFIFILIFALFVAIWFADYVSYDYYAFLSEWIKDYRTLSFRDCLLNITNISNYTPIYNYFLIIIAKLNLNPLYSIKFITFVFSLLLAVLMELVVSHVKKVEFNYLRAAFFILIPTVCMEYSFWGQSDTIYVFFCVLAFYFALKKKSKLSFLSVGLAFSFKLQFLFVVPILFVMLIIKDENGEHYIKWKDIWIAPVIYAVNLIPVFVGASIVDLLFVYFVQTAYYSRLSLNCANFCFIFEMFDVYQGNSSIYTTIVVILSLFTIALLLFFVVRTIKLSKKMNLSASDLLFFAILFSFIMVFFMPKMHDRFYFLTTIFAIMLLCSKLDKNSLYIALTIELSLYFVMYTQFAFTQEWILNNWSFMTSLSLILNIIILIFLVYSYFRNYKLNTHQNLPIENASVNNVSKET